MGAQGASAGAQVDGAPTAIAPMRSRSRPFGPDAFIWRNSRKAKFLIDLALLTLTIPLAFYIRLEAEAWTRTDAILLLTLIAAPTFAFVAREFRFHRQSWAHIGAPEFRRLIVGIAFASILLFGVVLLLQRTEPIPRSVPLLSGMLGIILLSGVRLGFFTVYGLFWDRDGHSPTAEAKVTQKRVVILGAGSAGTILARELQRHQETGYRPVAFLDDDPQKKGLDYHGVPVVGSLTDLPEAMELTRADEALFTIPSAKASHKRIAFELADEHDIPIRIVPNIFNLLTKDDPGQVKEVLGTFIQRRRPRNILLIGGAGYIGSALIPRLLDSGYRVRILDTLLYGTGPIQEYLDHPNFEVIEGDFRQVNRLVEAMQGIDTVVHLGAIVGDPACALDEDLTVEVNLVATKMVAEVAKGYGVTRFLFASTCSVYGASDELLDENSKLNPVSLYARTKIASEKVLLSMADEHFNPIILRFGTVYGFSGRIRFDLVVNLLTAKAIKNKEITLYGGDQWRPFIHVQDVAKAVQMSMEAPPDRTAGEVFNVGSNKQNLTLYDVAKKVQTVVPQAKITDSGSDSDRRNYRVDFDRIEKIIGFTPDWSIEDGIKQVATAVEDGLVVDYTAAAHSNVRFLTEEGFSKIVRKEFGSVMDFLEAEQPEK